uniref:Yippee domain-containing protein n=1 Tax=Noctiluca scintillans TaxID=2966 RepID=A0A7S1AGJ3_NOCSC|mmetsp:Transcript_45289/g.120114  ORF Transcript_45289/g.120114 Transcript_45289/m.120114 type:complete len:613 (+) Transcript_45289:69-1907(+)
MSRRERETPIPNLLQTFSVNSTARSSVDVRPSWTPPEDAVRLVVDFAIGTILELLALALVDRQFNRLAWRRFQHELRWLGTSDDTHLLAPQVASQFVALPGVKLSSPGVTERRQACDPFVRFSERDMLLHCQACVLPLLRVDDVISSNYRIMTGRAYLAAIVSNVERASDAYEALYTTGQYTVRNVACAGCKTRLGVMYEDCADRHNAHKIGKYLLGQRLLTRPACCLMHENPESLESSKFCARCSSVSLRGAMRITQMMTGNLSIFLTRHLYGLLLQQNKLECARLDRIRKPRSAWCCPLAFKFARSRRRLVACGTEWRDALLDRLAMLAVQQVVQSGAHFHVALTVAVRFVNTVCQVAAQRVPLGSQQIERVPALLRFLPAVLPGDQADALFVARALVVAVRNEWVVGTPGAWTARDEAELTIPDLEVIVNAITARAACGLTQNDHGDAREQPQQQQQPTHIVSQQSHDSSSIVSDQEVLHGELHCLCGNSVVKIEAILADYRMPSGPAYLAETAQNVSVLEEVQPAVLGNGEYTAREVVCARCRAALGVTYVSALERDNEFRVGKFLLGQDQMTLPSERPKNEAAFREQLLELIRGHSLEPEFRNYVRR